MSAWGKMPQCPGLCYAHPSGASLASLSPAASHPWLIHKNDLLATDNYEQSSHSDLFSKNDSLTTSN